MNNGSIGQSVNVKGDLTAQEDLTIDWHIDGTVTLDKNVLTVGHHGTLKATVLAKTVIVQGEDCCRLQSSKRSYLCLNK